MILQVKPAYLANASLEEKEVIEPISAKIPLANTGPMPGIEINDWYSVVFMPLMFFSIALSISLISIGKALITLNEEAIAIFIGS